MSCVCRPALKESPISCLFSPTISGSTPFTPWGTRRFRPPIWIAWPRRAPPLPMPTSPAAPPGRSACPAGRCFTPASPSSISTKPAPPFPENTPLWDNASGNRATRPSVSASGTTAPKAMPGALPMGITSSSAACGITGMYRSAPSTRMEDTKIRFRSFPIFSTPTTPWS